MPLLSASDLMYDYSWTVVSGDNPQITGVPDEVLLNRDEGYEMLAFINRIAEVSQWTEKHSALKVERLIKKHLPSDIRARASIWQWLIDNWNKFA